MARRHISGIGITLAIGTMLFVVLPAFLLTAAFVAPLALLALPVMLAWAVAEGAAGHRHRAPGESDAHGHARELAHHHH